MAEIHATAIVESGARIGDRVRIGPYCVVGPDVVLGDDVVLQSHVVVEGRTRIGDRCRIYPFAAVGTAPQDLKYDGEESELQVGEGTVIREHATLHPGTRGGHMVTRVGANCLLMIGAHVAHDCQVGDGVIMANCATLGGHVEIGDHCVLGGLVAVHQFVRIGRGAMIGGMSGVENDIIPYGMALGNRARLNGLNVVGLKRQGIAKSELQNLRAAYQTLFDRANGTFQERLQQVESSYNDAATVRDVIAFVRADSDRPLCQPKLGDGG